MNQAAYLVCLSLVSASCLGAMDRWPALSMIESGDNDHAIGPAGEVSRYQIKREVWDATASGCENPSDPKAAFAVAQAIMRERSAAFENRFHRPPTDFEFYVLWNAPAYLIGPRDRPAITKAVAARAQRFCNLVARQP